MDNLKENIKIQEMIKKMSFRKRFNFFFFFTE